MSSLFSTSPLFSLNATSSSSQAAPTTSLFGNTASSQAQSSSIPSINISGTPTSSQPQKPPLFSSLGGGDSKPSLFGSSQSQQQTSSSVGGGGLFDRITPATSGGFGATSTAVTSRSPGLSLSGAKNNTNTSQASGSSIFGATNNATTSQPAGSSLFGLQQPKQQDNQQGQPQQQQQGGQSIQQARQPAYFDNLLQKGRKRTHDAQEGSGLGDLPSLQLTLGDIAKKARELGGTGVPTHNGKGADSKAHYLLAASGVNPGTTRRDLDSLATQRPASVSVQQVADWDPNTHKYVEQLQQQSTLKMMSEGLGRAQRNFDAYLEEHVDINWELQRKKIYEHFGLVPKGGHATDTIANGSGGKGAFGKSSRRGRWTKQPDQSTIDRSIFGQSGLQKSVIGTPGVGYGNTTLFADVEKNSRAPTAQDDRFLREKQRRYGDRIQNLNRARLDGAPYPVLKEFKGVESQAGGESPRQLADAYDALMEIASEGKAKERQYAEDYLDENLNSAKSIKIRKKIIDGSRRYLEKAFYDQLESIVAKNPKEANIGGVPTTINKVRAYIRIRAARRDLIPDGTELKLLDDDYCWALIFFLLRSGLVKEATEYVTTNKRAFSVVDRSFATYITEYASKPDRRLDQKAQDHISREYQKRTRVAPESQSDPYQIACYKIIGRCELSKRSVDTISQGVEDWIWLQFNLAREVSRIEESAGDVFGLEEVRETINEIGQRHFSQGAEGMGGYGTFFFLQILGGLFEQAISYLYSYSYTAAVHFAIALDYYGLLRVSDFAVGERELLTFDTKQLPQISFGRMLGFYTRDFRAGNVEAAVDYLTLICLNAHLSGEIGRSQASLCHEALRELVLETREFAQLLGDIRSDGTRLKGAIERRLKLLALSDTNEFLKIITIQAASVADDAGRTTDAVLLYHLAEDYDNVITIINRALSESIAIDIGAEQLRLQPLKPRAGAQQKQNQQQQQQDGSSLSLTSVDDPIILARNMISLYNSNAMYFQKIRPMNREACGLLLRMSEAKAKVAAGQWSEAIDTISSLNLLPLKARASIPSIRASATSFNALPPTISRNIGPLLLWTITCVGQLREVLGQREYGAGEGSTNKEISDELLGSARDLMVFAGLVKYRLGERVWEAVCGVGGEVGAY